MTKEYIQYLDNLKNSASFLTLFEEELYRKIECIRENYVMFKTIKEDLDSGITGPITSYWLRNSSPNELMNLSSWRVEVNEKDYPEVVSMISLEKEEEIRQNTSFQDTHKLKLTNEGNN